MLTNNARHCRVDALEKLSVHHISFNSGTYSYASGMPKRLEAFLAGEIDLPDNFVVAVSNEMPSGSWDFVPELAEGDNGHRNRLSFKLVQKQDDQEGGFGATVVSQIIQVFELSDSCMIDEILVEP